MLIGMQGFGMLLSFGLTVLITRGLDVANYGLFRYAMTFLMLAMMLLQFGWPFSASRLLALENERAAQKEIVGASLVMLMISVTIGTVMTFTGFWLAESLGYHLPRIIIWVAPFLHVTLGQYMISNICQGMNRISLLSFQQVLPYLLLLPVTAVQIYIFANYSLAAAVIGYVVTFSVVIAIGFFRLGFSFAGWRSRVRMILKENRGTGFPTYIGGICGVASGQVVAMWVSEFVDPSRYGQYALALAVSSPLSVSVSSIGTVIFRSSSKSRSLSKKVLTLSLALGGALGLAYVIAAEKLLVLAFGAKYGPSVQMVQLMGIGALLIGWGDILNRFLGAQGWGKGLGLAAVSTGVVGIVSAAILLPTWNVYGAIVSSILSSATYFGLMVVLYIICTARHRRGGLALAESDLMSPKVESGAP